MPEPSPTTKPSRLGVKRAAGAFGLVVARRKRAHGAESADAHRRHCRFRAAGDHHFGVAALDNLVCVAHGVGPGGASRGRRGIRALRSVADRDVARCKVHDCGRNEKRGDLARAAIQIFRMLALDDVESADARSDVDAGSVGEFRCDLKPGHANREIRRSHRQMDEPRHLLDFFFLDPVQRIETLHFAGDLAIEGGQRQTG